MAAWRTFRGGYNGPPGLERELSRSWSRSREMVDRDRSAAVPFSAFIFPMYDARTPSILMSLNMPTQNLQT